MARFVFKAKNKTKEPESVDHAYDYAVFLLSLRLRTIGEVLKKMQDRGYTERVIGETIERLKEQKYLDDRRYAEIFLENLKTYRNFGYYGIKKKFLDKKLPAALIDAVLEEGLSLEDEVKIGKRLLKKEGYDVKARRSEPGEIQYSTYADSEEQQEKHKIAQRLRSRGFRSEAVSKLVF